MDTQGVKAFTTTYKTISDKLINDALIVSTSNQIPVKALWDTGATMSCISHGIAKSLGSSPVGKQQISTPSGSKTVDTYIVDIKLPNDVVASKMLVCETDIGSQGIDLLIGMDIIGMGDFSVSNHETQTVFTFRVPSQKVTDYAKQLSAQKAIGSLHGRGKRRKK